MLACKIGQRHKPGRFKERQLPITHIHTYLVHPAKGVSSPPTIGGAAVRTSGKMFDLLKGIYERSDTECNIAISFNHAATGAQQNDCRDLILTYLQGPSVARGRNIATRLAAVTTNRSHLGLMFLIAGMEGPYYKIVLSRFPADSGIMAEENSNGLTVAFLERIFMKSAKSYKAVLYKHTSFETGFWEGRAIDKQINSSDVEIPNYWITDFLDSDFRTTSAAGTRRLAVACRDAARKSGASAIKSEIAAAATLATGLGQQRLSIRGFAQRIGLSQAAQAAIFAELKPSVVDETFQLAAAEFMKVISYRSIELDNGGVLTAEVAAFDTVFDRQQTGSSDNKVRFSTVGKILSEKLGKARQ